MSMLLKSFTDELCEKIKSKGLLGNDYTNKERQDDVIKMIQEAYDDYANQYTKTYGYYESGGSAFFIAFLDDADSNEQSDICSNYDKKLIGKFNTKKELAELIAKHHRLSDYKEVKKIIEDYHFKEVF